ncbi:MAG: conserved transrane protein [Blastococcus sp.]|nr:conserved transrane protein [Blastococcus sp.]
MAKSDGTDAKVKAREKAAKQAEKATKKAGRREKLTQLRTAFTMTRKADGRLIPLLVLAFLVPFVLLLALGLVVGGLFIISFTLFGILLGGVAVIAVFGRRLQSSQYTQVEGQSGAAAAVIQSMRGDWRVTPAVGYSKEADLVHRVLGRPGVVLVGEGNPQRVGRLIAVEKKKLARFAGDVPVYDIQVGDDENQVPLRRVEKHFAKLPRNIKPKDVNVLDRKLKAMPGGLPIPKGPVPGMGGHQKRPKQR